MSKLHTMLALSIGASAALAQTPCDQLKLAFPDATVNLIQFVPAGPFAAPAPQIAPIPAAAPAAEPALAAVVAVLAHLAGAEEARPLSRYRCRPTAVS